MLLYSLHPSPIGEIHAISTDSGLAYLDFSDNQERITTFAKQHFGGLFAESSGSHTDLDQRLSGYFNGGKNAFSGLKLDIKGTEFQKQAWHYLLSIPHGETRSYKDEAIALHKPKGAQAIGQANSRNPISIVIPCHRVVGKNGKLTGYAGGLQRKAFLLALENNQRRLL